MTAPSLLHSYLLLDGAQINDLAARISAWKNLRRCICSISKAPMRRSPKLVRYWLPFARIANWRSCSIGSGKQRPAFGWSQMRAKTIWSHTCAA